MGAHNKYHMRQDFFLLSIKYVTLFILIFSFYIISMENSFISSSHAEEHNKNISIHWVGDKKIITMEPYVLDDSFTLSFLSNIYEGLVRRNKNLEIIPSLAENWEEIEPQHWRFFLRKGVIFHNGNGFNADDVIFSVTRIKERGSALKSRLESVERVEKIDDYTVDFYIKEKGTAFLSQWESWFILDKEWFEDNKAEKPVTRLYEYSEDTQEENNNLENEDNKKNLNYIIHNANGTGPFSLKEFKPRDILTLETNENWWGERKYNFQHIYYSRIASAQKRAEALISGKADIAYNLNMEDMNRIGEIKHIDTKDVESLKIIFLGFNHAQEEIKGSNIKGKGRNPLKDARVRKAFLHAIDIEAIKRNILKDDSPSLSLMASPALYSDSSQFTRPPFDPDAARRLLKEAGYPEGFNLRLDCSAGLFTQDEIICETIVSMLERVGIKIKADIRSASKYLPNLMREDASSSFFILSWTVSDYNNLSILEKFYICDNNSSDIPKINISGYCNEKIDNIINNINKESDDDKKKSDIVDIYKISSEDVAYIPLFFEKTIWGKKDNINLAVRADQWLLLYETDMTHKPQMR